MIELETKFSQSGLQMSVAGGNPMLPSSKQTDFFYTTTLFNTRGSNPQAPPIGVYEKIPK